jgi:parallel beta-helix repeat protein
VLVLLSTINIAITIIPDYAEATTRYVGGGGPGNFTFIQDAINASSAGDTIFVFNGTYLEHVSINKPLTLVGEDRDNTVIDGGGFESVVNMTANWANITQFSIVNSGQVRQTDAGIRGYYASNCTISNNTISNNTMGIGLYQSRDIFIEGNSVQSNEIGVFLEESDFVSLTQNILTNNDLGVFLISSNYAILDGNSFNLNYNGIEAWLSDRAFLQNNTMSSTLDWGIALWASNHSVIHKNQIYGSGDFAIDLSDSSYSNVSENSLIDNLQGIRIGYSDTNILSRNNISNSGYGIRFDGSDGNVVVANDFHNNSMSIILSSSTNHIFLNNSMTVTGLDIGGGLLENWNTHMLDTSNTVDGKPIIYFKNVTGGTIPSDIAQVVIANSSQVILEDQSIDSRNTYGVAVAFSSDSQIRNITFATSDTMMGVFLVSSENTTISDSDILVGHTIEARYSNYTSVDNNRFLASSGYSPFYRCNSVAFTNNVFTTGSSTLSMASINNLTIANNSGFGRLDLYMDGIDRGRVAYNDFPRIDIFAPSSDNITVEGNTYVNILSLYGNDDSNVLNNTFNPVGSYALVLYGVFNSHVTGNTISDSEYGIHAEATANNTIAHNVITGNSYGIYFNRSSFNTVQNNTVFSIRDALVLEEQCQGNTIVNNTALSGLRSGVRLTDSESNTLSYNTVSGGLFGVRLSGSNYNQLENNTIIDSSFGVSSLSAFNTIANNTLSNNGVGITLHVGGNRVYHNSFIDNVVQANDFSGGNSWDNGYPSGGNYWSDYSGIDIRNGPNQDMVGSDGMGDTPYYIVPAWISDRYPLMLPFAANNPLPPTLLSAYLSGSSSQDVTISWALSFDDGAGIGSVSEYEIYRGSIFDLQGTGYSLLASLPNGTFKYVDTLAGEGDPVNYFYLICAKDLGNLTRCSSNQAAKFTESLSARSNLISTPLIQLNESVGTVLQTVSFNAAHIFDSKTQKWMHYDVLKPHLAELSLNCSMGMWVNITIDSNFTVAGLVPIETAISLEWGWNLVGYPSFNTTYTFDDVRVETGATRIEGYDPTNTPYHLRELLSGGMLTGRGYWIWVDTEALWTLPGY